MLTPMTPISDAGGLPPAAGHFHTTRWTQVIQAKESSREGQDALRELCEAYYAPVQAFLRRQGREAEVAREVAHEFFAYMLEGQAIRTAEKVKGRFRSYLLGAIKHFLAHRHEAAQRLRRGAGQAAISLSGDDDEASALVVSDEAQLSPDLAFDRQWALTVLDRAMQALHRESEAEGKAQVFIRLQPWLTGESEHGNQAALAEELGLNLNSLKSMVYRLRQRFRHWVREEVASTLPEGSDVEEELQMLFSALRNR